MSVPEQARLEVHMPAALSATSAFLSPRAARGRAFAVLAIAAFTAILCVATAGRASAQFPPYNPWSPIGPDGGTVQAFALDPILPGQVWAATREATIWSGHAGRTWRFEGSLSPASRDGKVVTGPELGAFAISPTGLTMYAAIGPQIYWCCIRHEWAPKGRMASDGEVRQLVVVSDWVAIARVGPSPQTNGLPSLERSTDAGLTWSAAPLPDEARPLELVAGSPAGRLYALTDRGVYRSLDSGATWAGASEGLPQGLRTIAIAPSSPSTLYVFDASSQLYRATDGDDRWRRRGVPLFAPNPIAPIKVVQLVVDAADASALYVTALHHAGRVTLYTFHRSTDGGLTWQRIDHPNGGAASGLLATVPASPPTLLAALPGERGVAVSDDRGETFTASRGLHALSIETLALSVRPPSIVYAGALPLTVATSTDGGEHWTRRLTLGLGGFGSFLVRDLAADPRDPSLVWGVDDLSVFRVAEAGRRVERIVSPFGFGASRLAVGLAAPETLYVVGNEECTLQKSTDAGATWSCPGASPLDTPSARALEVDPLDPDTVHLVDGSGRLFRTDDGAESWELVRADLDVTALAVDPLEPATLYAGTAHDGVWKSVDGGSSWSLLADSRNGLPTVVPVTELLAHPVDPHRLYVSYVGRGVFATVDGGETFHRLGAWIVEPLPSSLVSGPLAIDPRLPSRVYTGTLGAGVWMATHERPAPCVVDERTLCLGSGLGGSSQPSGDPVSLSGGRFRVQARWRDFQGRSGAGRAVRLTDDAGYFWFFSPDNLELVVKALDGRPLNDRFWIFYGALSNVEFQLVVTDTETGEVNAYFNPERQFASRGDTSAFPRDWHHAARASLGKELPPLFVSHAPDRARIAGGAADASACQGDDLVVCLGEGRFRVSVEWRDFQGSTGAGHGRALNDSSGWFWFFDEANLEIAIKVLDGRSLNGHFWVFYGALSNVEYRLTVEDTATGARRSYFNPAGQFASRGDTTAFAAP